jgi:thioredoxin reductase
MSSTSLFDVIVIGGSFAGLSAALSLGRSFRTTLIIDSGKPCNLPTQHSHNFITHDGESPRRIREKALLDIKKYDTVQLLNDTVLDIEKINNKFQVTTKSNVFSAKKLLFASGIIDELPLIEGFAESWGKSIAHCPYCHGYEFKNKSTGLFMNMKGIAEHSLFLTNWSKDFCIFTNGDVNFEDKEKHELEKLGIPIISKKITEIVHKEGQIQKLVFEDGTEHILDILYVRLPFHQSTDVPKKLGCRINEMGFIEVDPFYRTTMESIYAAGDNSSLLRSLAHAVFSGSTAGAFLNRELVLKG